MLWVVCLLGLGCARDVGFCQQIEPGARGFVGECLVQYKDISLPLYSTLPYNAKTKVFIS